MRDCIIGIDVTAKNPRCEKYGDYEDLKTAMNLEIQATKE